MSAGMLSRLWRVYSRPLGSSAHWDTGSPFAMQGDCFTGSLPRSDIPSANVAAALAALPNRKQYDGKPDWARSGRATHWVSSFGCPSSCGQGIKAAGQRTSIFARTYHERLDLLNGKLSILFLNGMLPNTVPLLFGELFTTVLYDGVAIDPGSPKMRRSLARHLKVPCRRNIHVKTLQRYARLGRLPGYQIGGHWYFRASELDAWLQSRINSNCQPADRVDFAQERLQ
jgi:excisionase family DNA binding protein